MEFLVILALALLNGILSMAEMAVVSAKKARLSTVGTAGAKAALQLAEDSADFLPTVQVGITVMATISAAKASAHGVLLPPFWRFLSTETTSFLVRQLPLLFLRKT